MLKIVFSQREIAIILLFFFVLRNILSFLTERFFKFFKNVLSY